MFEVISNNPYVVFLLSATYATCGTSGTSGISGCISAGNDWNA